MNQLFAYSGQKGLSRLEFAVVVCLIALIIGIGLGYFRQLISAAERASFEQDLGAIRSAVGLKVLHTLTQDRAHMADLLEQNPLTWLEQPPQSYQGEFKNWQSISAREPGWYYLSQTKMLIYIVRRPDELTTPVEGVPRLRYRLTPIYTDTTNNGRYDPEVDLLSAVRLMPVETAFWLQKKIF